MKQIHGCVRLGVTVATIVVACSSPNEPLPPGGRVVFRFQPQSVSSAAADGRAASATAATFDSVIVRVFRAGGSIVQEAAKGAAITGPEPIELALGCIAEQNKRVSVELFEAGAMTYHGANTDVDVNADKDTSVNVDAYLFTIAGLVLSPGMVPEGSSFSMQWNSAPAAGWYRVQSSATPDFATVAWEQSVTDTLLDAAPPAGMHYFRVLPMTQFATGSPTGAQPGYVAGGSGSIKITGFNPEEAIPGDSFTIEGENLDYPGTRAWIGSDELVVESATWNSMVVTLPLVAKTAKVAATSGSAALGSDTYSKPFVAQRVAYVTDGGGFAAQYVSALATHGNDFGNSGVAVVPVEDLDWRDMNAFDIVIVADDTGAIPASWGGGTPARASAIAVSRANVLAMGKGGAVFLEIATSGANVPQQTATDDGVYYVPDTGAQIFTTPHSAGATDMTFCTVPARTVSFQITARPTDVNLYASTGKNCPILVCSPNDRWVLSDFRFSNPGGTPVIYFHWGYAGDPDDLTARAVDCLGNVMYMLYTQP